MTYDPLRVIEKPKVGTFSGVPSAAPGTVLVVDRAGHPIRVLDGPDHRLTAGEARWGQIRTLYAVDVTDHHLEFTDTLPCKDDVGGFRATVKLDCKVTDPAAVVHRGIHDVAPVLIPPVTETLRRVCGEFAAEESERAEQASLDAIRDLEARTGHDQAFQVSRVHIQLQPDEGASSFIRGRKEAERDLTRQQDAARLEKEKADLEAELARKQQTIDAQMQRVTAGFDLERLEMQRTHERLKAQLDDQRQELELAREAARARAQQLNAGELEMERLEFEMSRQQKQAELDRQKLELDMARARIQVEYDRMQLTAKLESDKLQITQLMDLLNRGEFAALAMQLAQNPAAIGSVTAYLADQRDADISRQLHALKLLVENDGLEGYQITEQAKSVLLQLINTWSSRSSQLSVTTASQTPELESADVIDAAVTGDHTTADDEYPGDRQPSRGRPEAPGHDSRDLDED